VSEPIDRMLSDPARCRQFAPDVSVHWYPNPAIPVCHCGEIDKRSAADCDHEWMEFGGPGDEWRECFLCGRQEDA
jgi:hypothetical protein